MEQVVDMNNTLMSTITDLTTRNHEVFKKALKPINTKELCDMDILEFSIIKETQYPDIFHSIVPPMGFTSVAKFKISVELLIERGIIRYVSLRQLYNICDILTRLDSRIKVIDNEYCRFLRSVMRATMKVMVLYLLQNSGKTVRISTIFPRAFKGCYSLFRSNIDPNMIKLNNKQAWAKVYMIIVNACLKRRPTQWAYRTTINLIRNYTDIISYLQEDDFLEDNNVIFEGLLSRGDKVISEDIILEYKNYVLPMWEEFIKYKENPNWY